MTLDTAHKVLISVAAVFFGGYGAWELARGGPGAYIRAPLPHGVRGGLAVYLAWFWLLRKK